WSALFPKQKLKIFWFTAFIFIFWKSPFSEPFIGFWNNLSLFRISRIVDYTDLMALIVLPFSFVIENQKERLKTLTINPIFPLILAAFSFMATSYQKNFDYNKTYDFSFSKTELVKRINNLKTDSINHVLPLSLNIKNSNYFRLEGSDTSFSYVSKYELRIDTLYKGKTKEIDTILKYKIPNIDTNYVSKSGVFFYNIPVKKYMKESKTGYCDFVKAMLKLNGNETSSSLTILKIFTGNCMGMFEKKAQKNEKENLLNAFEEEIISKLKNQ
ncbi:MAG: hypothetical protein HXX09_16530, partial [Bacteroidetes bacterium]|nr:hypothetical protein [Bacteroidota bacterium]